MNTAQKVISGIMGIALLTTLVLPNRKTADVFRAGGDAGSKLLGTAMGTAGTTSTTKAV